MTRRFLFLVLVAASTIGVVLLGCSDKSTKPKPRDCQDCLHARTNPANVLNNLRVMYGVMDNNLNTPEQAHALAAQYRSLFHPDFKFYFLSGDAPPSFPEGWWGRDDEVAGFDTLMTKRALGIVTEIRLSWSPGATVPDNRANPNPPPELLHPGWLCIHVNSILLDIVEGQNTLRVQDGLADFYFGPDPADSTLWVITEWREMQSAPSPDVSRTRSSVSAPEHSSWGKIKGLFR